MRSDLPYRALDIAVRAFNRNSFTSRKLKLLDEPTLREEEAVRWNQDGVRTRHVPTFLEDPRFLGAYARGVQAGTFDYGIGWRAHTLLWAAELASSVDGAFVECGTGRGFMASAVCEYLDWSDRPFYLFDTFETSDRPERPYYADGPAAVAANFAEWPGVQLVVGRIPETLASVEVGSVAFLHVDMNAAEPEEAAVRHFWPLLAPGGVMVFDDYGFASYPESRATADRLGRELGYGVYNPPSGQGVVIKRAAR